MACIVSFTYSKILQCHFMTMAYISWPNDCRFLHQSWHLALFFSDLLYDLQSSLILTNLNTTVLFYDPALYFTV